MRRNPVAHIEISADRRFKLSTNCLKNKSQKHQNIVIKTISFRLPVSLICFYDIRPLKDKLSSTTAQKTEFETSYSNPVGASTDLFSSGCKLKKHQLFESFSLTNRSLSGKLL